MLDRESHELGASSDLRETEIGVQNVLKKFTRRLHAGSLNYQADFLLKYCEQTSGFPLNEILYSALGKDIVVGGVELVEASIALHAITEALEYQGDEGSHPGRKYLGSARFRTDVSVILSAMDDLLGRADRIQSFWLKEGHPFYPVFWDFGFVIDVDVDSLVFIGSSSD